MNIRHIDLFREQFLTKLKVNKGDEINRLYYGRTAQSIAFQKERLRLKKENPSLDSDGLRELHRETRMRTDYFLEVTESKNQREESLLTELNKENNNFYDFIFLDCFMRLPTPRLIKGNLKPHSRLNNSKNSKYSNQLYEYLGEKYYFPSSLSVMLFETAKLLNKNGYLVILTAGNGRRGFDLDEIFEGILNNMGFYINAYIEEPTYNNNPVGRNNYIYILSRNNPNNLIYLAYLNFSYSFTYDSKSTKSNEISYFEPLISKNIFKRMQQGDFEYTFNEENKPIVFDWKKSDKLIKNNKINVSTINRLIKTLDVQKLNTEESIQSVGDVISYDKFNPSNFLYIRILVNSKSKTSQLKKSKVLQYLRHHPRVDSYHICPDELGGTNAIFVHINSEYLQPFINNFFENPKDLDDENNLSDGYFMNRADFYGFDQIEYQNKSEKSIFFNYGEGYKEYLLMDLTSINEEDNQDIFDEKAFELRKDGADKKGRLLAVLRTNYGNKVAVCIDQPEDIYMVSESYSEDDYLFFYVEDRAIARYIEVFLNSELGRQLYYSNLKLKGNQRKASAENLRNLKILMPEVDEIREKTIKAYDKINELKRSINELNDDFTKNPSETINNNLEMLDDMLLVVGRLNEIDQIYAIIRGEEGPDVEFKQTFRLPVGDNISEDKFKVNSSMISAGVMKVINSFINANGGELLIGIKDANHQITGLENELDHFFSNKDETLLEKKDKFNLIFNSKLNQTFQERFVTENITYKFVDLDNDKYIFRVTCLPSDKPCIIKETSKLLSYLGGNFFRRTGSESVPLSGQEKQDYIDDHFYNNNREEHSL